MSMTESLVSTPLHVKGMAVKAGISRNNALYTIQWLEEFRDRLSGAPIYIEHVRVPNAAGKVTKTFIEGDELWYEGDIYDDKLMLQIRNGLVQHTSVGFNYKQIDMVDGHMFFQAPGDAELSIVAAPGVRGANIATESVYHYESTEAKVQVVHEEPFAGYKDFDACVAANQDKADPKAYCATIMRAVEESAKPDPKDARIKELEEAYSKIVKSNEELKATESAKISQAKLEGKSEVLKDIKDAIPHPYIENRFSWAGKRFAEDVKKVIRKHGEDNHEQT